MKAKPKFLVDIEKSIRKELKNKDLSPQERINIFRTGFQDLINNIQTFGPILYIIKTEYDDFVRGMSLEMKHLEGSSKRIIAEIEKFEAEMSSDDDSKAEQGRTFIETFRRKREKEKRKRNHKTDELKVEIMDKQAEIKQLHHQIDLRDQKIQEYEKVQQNKKEEMLSVMEQFTRYRAEKDKEEDPFVLRKALDVSRSQLWSLQDKLRDVGEHGLSKQLVERLEEKKNQLEEKMSLQTKENKLLKNELIKAKKETEMAESARNEIEQQLQDLRNCGTPRPNWNSCGQEVPGGTERWCRTVRGKTSEQILSILIDEIQQIKAAGKEFIEPRGTGIRVPVYLRYDGSVKNLNIDYKMLCQMIADIMCKKEERNNQDSLAGYLKDYTKQKYSTEPLQMEFTYNMVDGLQRFNKFPHIQIFKECLEHKRDDECILRILALIRELHSASNILRNKNKKKCSSLARAEFSKVLISKCYKKSEIALERLMKIAHKESLDEFQDPCENVQKINVSRIFRGQKDWDFSNFVQEIFSQDHQEKTQFVQEIMSKIETQGLKTKSDISDLLYNFNLTGSNIDQVMGHIRGSPAHQIDLNELRRQLTFTDFRII